MHSYRPYQSILIRFDNPTGWLAYGNSGRPGIIVIARDFPSSAKLPSCQNWSWGYDGGTYLVWSKIELPNFTDVRNIWFSNSGVFTKYFDLTKLPAEYLDSKIGGFRLVTESDIIGPYKSKCNFCK